MDVGKDLVLDMYRKMHRIRCFEQKIKELITTAEIPGFLYKRDMTDPFFC